MRIIFTLCMRGVNKVGGIDGGWLEQQSYPCLCLDLQQGWGWGIWRGLGGQMVCSPGAVWERANGRARRHEK